MARLSQPGWPVTHRDDLSGRIRLTHLVLTWLDVDHIDQDQRVTAKHDRRYT